MDEEESAMAATPALDVVATIRLAPEVGAPAKARRFLRDFCAAARLPDTICDTAALLASELVTNAILHGRTSAALEVHRPADTLRVAVRDANPDLPPVGDAPPLSAESGRGLMIVSVLASRWGVETTPDGKAVWFELDLDP